MKRALKSLIKAVIPRRYRPAAERLWARNRHRLVYPMFLGNRFVCPFCGGRFRKLLARGFDLPVLRDEQVVGAGYRPNSTCPRCLSFDRERLVYLYLERKTDLFSRMARVLHVAPEEKLGQALLARPNIDYLSLDLAAGRAMAVADIAHLPHADDAFDVVICNHVLEHVPDDREPISELYRVLRSGGYAILQVPVALKLDRTYEDPTVTAPEQRVEKFGQADHVRLYGRDYPRRLERAGFSVEEYSFSDEFGEAFARRYALLDDERLFVCRKPSRNGG